MNRTAVIAKIEEIAERVAQPEGIEIVEVELKGAGRHQVLCIVIDRPPAPADGVAIAPESTAPSGVTHSDCELISHQVGTILDDEDVIHGTYSLEVSSPGVERKLLMWRDWERFIGKKARVVLREPATPVAGGAIPKAGTKHFDGTIARAEASEQSITVELSDGANVTFPFSQVDRANLKFEW